MKRLAALVLAGALALSLPAGAVDSGFSDVGDGDWFAPCVEVCVREGLMVGIGDGRFEPEGTVGMGEAVVMAARILWRANGGEGPLPEGGTAEELARVFYGGAIRRFGEEPCRAAMENFCVAVEPFAQSYAWDGLCYLYGQATDDERLLLPDYHLCDPDARVATRQEFFYGVAFAAQLPELASLNEVTELPDTEDKTILALYRKGLLAGVDERGTFAAERFLTRAEAAAVLARVVEPEMRLTFTLPAPAYREYTLTAVDLRGWETYGTEEGGAAGWLPVYREEPDGTVNGIYRADGTIFFQELEGGYPYSGEGPGSVGDTPYATLCRGPDREEWALFDVEQGRFTVSYQTDYEAYRAAAHLEDQHLPDGFACTEDEEGWYAVDAAGQAVLPGRYDDLINCGDGVFVYREGERWGLVTTGGTKTDSPVLNGYMDLYPYHAKGGVLPVGGRYYNYEMVPVTPAFDWAGPIGDDGAGFVGMDGGVYRIQFETAE